MAINGLPIDSSPLNEIPIGTAARFFQEENHEDEIENKMTEAEKERVILQYKDAKNERERKQILQSSVPDGNITALFEGPSAG
ncbi:MAG: hypothetical protein LBM69_01215 [Lachnospiraceae bacterium]|jgi:hypothetical protein|nr:hypothetical protein [Lachnospiraceae bacterium]